MLPQIKGIKNTKIKLGQGESVWDIKPRETNNKEAVVNSLKMPMKPKHFITRWLQLEVRQRQRRESPEFNNKTPVRNRTLITSQTANVDSCCCSIKEKLLINLMLVLLLISLLLSKRKVLC